MTDRIVVVGGGPAGLFFARLSRLARPGTCVEVHERGAAEDAFGFGVTFSARTMMAVRAVDAPTHDRIAAASVPIADMELRLPARTLRYGGFDYSSISRRALLRILQEQAGAAGADLRFGSRVSVGADADGDADVVVIADGARSTHRDARRERFGTTVESGSSLYMWLGTPAPFDAATFAFVRDGRGAFAAHAYPCGDGLSTVVVETDPVTWRICGMDRATAALPAGGSDDAALAVLTEIFAEHLGGQALVGNRSRWNLFGTVRNRRWSDGSAVLLGDAAHTAHFTVGSGTRMAMEDAIALAAALGRGGHRDAAFAEYERARRGPVTRTQRWAEPSMRWWETFGCRLDQPPEQFGMHFMTRTPALGYGGMRRRFADRVAEAEAAYRAGPGGPAAGAHAVEAPLRIGAVELPGRVVEVRPTGGPPSPGTAVLAAPDGSAVTAAVLVCPTASEWSGDGDELVARARAARTDGATAVLLSPGPGGGPGWTGLLGHSSRIRTEGAVPVAVPVPDGWALDTTTDPAGDTWPARIQLALVSGRVDLVAGRPLRPPVRPDAPSADRPLSRTDR